MLVATLDMARAVARFADAYLCNRDASSGGLADVANLAAATANDTSNHVGGDADVLSLDLLTVLVVSGRAAGRSVGIRATAEWPRAAVAEVGSVASAHHARASVVTTAAVTVAGAAQASRAGRLSSDDRVVKHSAGAPLPIIDKALGDLPNGSLDTLGGALDFDDALGRLGQHILLRNHADAGNVLDMLDLEALSADDGAHLVVGDEKLDGYCFGAQR